MAAAAAASAPATLQIGGHTVPRLCFGLGSLMHWAPGHTHPMPTDSSAEVAAALAAGIRHLDCGDLYTNLPSAAAALRAAALPRADVFLSLKLNTHHALRPAGGEDMVASVGRFIEDFCGGGGLGGGGYVDAVLLHFPPRGPGQGGNLSNREAWRVLEELKGRGLARIIGVSNFSLGDYEEIFAADDLRYKPEVHECEMNPHMLFDPSFQARRAFELEEGIVPKHYGVLTPVTDRLSKRSASPELLATLDQLSRETGKSPHEILLKWAWDNFDGILVTSTSKPERAEALTRALAEGERKLERGVYERLEAAAKRDGYEGKQFYLHPHLNK